MCESAPDASKDGATVPDFETWCALLDKSHKESMSVEEKTTEIDENAEEERTEDVEEADDWPAADGACKLPEPPPEVSSHKEWNFRRDIMNKARVGLAKIFKPEKAK